MEFRTYTHALSRIPPRSMAAGITTQDVLVDVDLARQQHQVYLNTLQTLGIQVTKLDPEESYPDSHFVEDAAIIHHQVAILSRPGAVERRGEVSCLRPELAQHLQVCELGGDESALVDGGDVLFMGNYVLIGISDRTTHAGAARLKTILNEIDSTLSIHNISFSGVLHLKSGLTALGPDLLIGNPQMKLHEPLPAGQVVWLPPEQGYGANTLVVNNAALYFAECPAVQQAIQAAGLNPLPHELSEFRKMDGSFTCLSLLW